MVSTQHAAPRTSRPDRRSRSAVYDVLLGLASLGVLLQGLWAGLFVREGHQNDGTWVTVHARGAEVTIVLAALATVAAFVRLRGRREVVAGTAVFTALLLLESYLGGLVGDHNALEVVHFPLALALLALAVWLPLRARRPSPAG